jgi:hypothetical protein
MSLAHSPRIITDGLVFCVDAADKKSYIGSGSTWTDRKSGNNQSLNGATFDSGNRGSIVFDGVNDYSINTGSSDYDLTEGTVECWAKVHSSTTNYFGVGSIVTINPYKGFGIHSYANSTKFSLFITYNAAGTIRYLDADNNYVIDQWYHLVGTVGASRADFYINGVRNEYFTYTTAIAPSSPPITIGRFYSNVNNFYAPCNIASVKFYNRALTEDEVLQNYNATKGRFGL